MTRRNNKRNQRREHNHEVTDLEAVKAVFSILGAALGDALKSAKDKPFSGIRQVSDNHQETGTIIPTDGTAVELTIPEGLEVFISEDGKPMIYKKVEGDEEHKNTFTPAAYYQLAKELYQGVNTYYWNVDAINESESVNTYECETDFDCLFNCNSEAQVKRLMEFNKLQNIAIWLNNGWHPNFKDDTPKFCISRLPFSGGYGVVHNTNCNEGSVYFKTEELAKQAIDIMGEQSLADLFNTKW